MDRVRFQSLAFDKRVMNFRDSKRGGKFILQLSGYTFLKKESSSMELVNVRFETMIIQADSLLTGQ